MPTGLGIIRSLRLTFEGLGLLAFLACCGVQHDILAEVAASGNPQGVYRGRDGDLQLSVTLRDDGCYRVEWLLNDEERGNSRGRWKTRGDKIELKSYQHGGSSGIPQFEHMNSLKEFRMVTTERRLLLVADWNFGLLNQSGVTPAIACYWTRDAPTPKQIPATEVTVVSIKEVVAQKKFYRGKRVGVIGNYSSHFEWSVIQEPGTDNERNARLWVGFGPVEWAKEEDVQWVQKGRVKVVGTVTFIETSPGAEGNYGHLGLCPAGIVDVEYFKLADAVSEGVTTNSPSPTRSKASETDYLLKGIEELHGDDLGRDGSGNVVSVALRWTNANNRALLLLSGLASLQDLAIQGRGRPDCPNPGPSSYMGPSCLGGPRLGSG